MAPMRRSLENRLTRKSLRKPSLKQDSPEAGLGLEGGRERDTEREREREEMSEGNVMLSES